LGWLQTADAAPLGLPLANAAAAQEAIDTIPLDRLTEDARQRIWNVVSKPSIYRQLPSTVIEADPDLYLFLVRHPEIVVNMWDLMGITKVTIQRTGDYTFDANDGAGTQCRLELVYGDRDVHVLYAQGHYEGPLLRRLVRGQCVLVLHSGYVQTHDLAVHVTSRLDMFVHFDNVGAELIARTLHPLVGKSADHNFVESTKFLGQVSLAAETRSAKLQRFSDRLTKVTPTVREQFVMLADMAARRAVERGIAALPNELPASGVQFSRRSEIE
jgi:hypothetical protein